MNFKLNLKLDKNEFIDFVKWTLDEKDYFVSSFDKIVVFHGGDSGNIYANKFLLWIYCLKGYNFISCHPKIVKDKLHFGNFIFPEFSGILSIDYTLSQNGYSVKIFIKQEPSG